MIILEKYEKSSLKPNTKLVVSLKKDHLTDYCDQLFADGFKDAVITTKVNSSIFTEPKLVFTWDGKPSDTDFERKKVELSLRNVLRNVKANSCEVKIKLTKKACDFLQNQTRYEKQYKFGDVNEQREISGKFVLVHSGEHFELDIDEKSVKKGDKESASYVESFGTFHTHPYEAYQRNNVCIAWPSADDYLAFLYMYGVCYTGFHVVSTIEGIYLISLKKYISPAKVLRKYKKMKDKIEYEHGADYPENDRYCRIDAINMSKIREYVKMINKRGKFNLVFKTWKECAEPFRLKYAPVDKNCLLSTQQANNLRELNSQVINETPNYSEYLTKTKRT